MISVKTREVIEKDSLFYNISSYSKVIRVIGWIKRFIFNCKNSTEARKEQFLTADEFGKAEICLIKIIQSKHFNSLEDECIKEFLPFIDDLGLIITKSKLLYRDDSFNFRCPVILPNKDYFVELLIREKQSLSTQELQ